MRRILVDLPQEYVDELDAIARARKLTRAEIIRKAISGYIEQSGPVTVTAFGIWKNRRVDGLEYQQTIRAEW